MKIHSIRLTIQDVPTKENVNVVALFGDIFLDEGKIMLGDDGKPKLTDENMPQPEYTKISFTSLLSQNVVFKREIQKMAITAITQFDIEQRKKKGEKLDFGDSYGLGIAKPKKKGEKVTKAKKRK